MVVQHVGDARGFGMHATAQLVATVAVAHGLVADDVVARHGVPLAGLGHASADSGFEVLLGGHCRSSTWPMANRRTHPSNRSRRPWEVDVTTQTCRAPEAGHP